MLGFLVFVFCVDIGDCGGSQPTSVANSPQLVWEDFAERIAKSQQLKLEGQRPSLNEEQQQEALARREQQDVFDKQFLMRFVRGVPDKAQDLLGVLGSALDEHKRDWAHALSDLLSFLFFPNSEKPEQAALWVPLEQKIMQPWVRAILQQNRLIATSVEREMLLIPRMVPIYGNQEKAMKQIEALVGPYVNSFNSIAADSTLTACDVRERLLDLHTIFLKDVLKISADEQE
ncbi:MAG: hypothetical protein AAB323_01535 [Pseudomonadota bacterium]